MRHSIPGRILLSVDLPKVAHAMTFGRHGNFQMNTDGQDLKLSLASDGKTADLMVDYEVLAAFIEEMAANLAQRGPTEPSVAMRLRHAVDKLVKAMEEAA